MPLSQTTAFNTSLSFLLHPSRSPLATAAERLLWPGRASPSASQLLAFSPGKEQAAGVWETPGLPVHHHFPEFTQTHVHRVGDAIQPNPVFLPGESQGLGEPGGLPSMGSHRVGHDWSDLAAAAAAAASYSVVQCDRHLMGQPLYCSADNAGV